jgi:hypothetical protein
MPDQFPNEIKDANAKALGTIYDLGLGPFVAGTPGFERFVTSGRRFKWVFTRRLSLSGPVETLAVVDSTLKHSVAAGGVDVVTAGSGVYLGDGRLSLNNDTGHYHTSFESLRLAETAWRALAFITAVQFAPRVDYTQALNRLF